MDKQELKTRLRFLNLEKQDLMRMLNIIDSSRTNEDIFLDSIDILLNGDGTHSLKIKNFKNNIYDISYKIKDQLRCLEWETNDLD